MEHENLSYTEALKYLAKKYHIEVVEKEETAEEIANRQEFIAAVSAALAEEMGTDVSAIRILSFKKI